MRKKILWLFERDCMPRTLWPLEWLAISYSILTTIFIPFLWPDMVHPWEMLSDRMFILAATFLLWGVWLKWPVRLMTFIRITVQMCLLNYWYPDTYEFNRTLPNLDHIFAEWESVLFGCQPSLEFSRLCPWGWFSEAVNMGYFSYYPMIVIVMVFFFLCRNRHYERASFVVMCSFFIYYLIYMASGGRPTVLFPGYHPRSCRNRELYGIRNLFQPPYGYASRSGRRPGILLPISGTSTRYG